MANDERFWNDCSFIYQTLVNRHDIPKDHIYPIMSDGDDPAEDMTLYDGWTFASQSLDLDNDGVNEIQLAATKSNIENTLNILNNILKTDDHLFIYIIDHGGTSDLHKNSDKSGNSYICLWNDEILSDYELANMLMPFTQKYVNINVVLGQCYSGGFIDDLNAAGCVVAAASAAYEEAWGCEHIPYDEFVYHWTCAINGADHLGNTINADIDYNGRVSMQEAFEYAKTHDRITKEHPQNSSTPISVGEDLAFNHLAPAVDLYVMDNPEDTGKEPNMTTDKFWLSPSIWIRNEPDGGTVHENPYYSEEHKTATVYIRIYNRGKMDYLGGSNYVHVFWAKASTGFIPEIWIGNVTDSAGLTQGGALIPYCIPAIEAGQYIDMPIIWNLPEHLLGDSSNNYTEKHHFCLLAKIMDTDISPALSGTLSYDLRGSNNDAQKNVSIISNKEVGNTTTAVTITNLDDLRREYALEIMPNSKADEAIFAQASILMDMSDPIYKAWVAGGSKSTDINIVSGLKTETFEFLSKDSRIDAISMPAKSSGKVGLRFNFRTVEGLGSVKRKYTLDLIQRDMKGNIIGGETFIVTSPDSRSTPITVLSTPAENGKTQLTANVEPGESVRWENEDGAVIGEGASIEVTPKAKSDNIYYVYALSDEGELSSGSIQLESEIGIERAAMNQQNTTLTIDLKGYTSAESSIVVSSVSTGDVALSYNLAEGECSTSIDVSALSQGVYAVTYIFNGEAIDSVKLSK